MAANYIPEGYHSLTPTLTIKGAKPALEFYKKAIEAEPNYPNAAEARKIIEDLEKPTKN